MPAVKFLLLLLLLLSGAGILSASTAKVPSFSFSTGETLHYTLSYRGLLTSMIWADLADVKMTFRDNEQTPDKHSAYQFELYLSTQQYAKAELFQPVRYHYKTTLDSNFQRTVLVEEIDNGDNQSHKFLWLDWATRESQLFKKRKKIVLSSGFLGLKRKFVWEKDDAYALPDFLNHYPLTDNKQSYLIHKKVGDKLNYQQILDPLSLIYSLRSIDFSVQKNFVKAVAVADDIRVYQVQQLNHELLMIHGKQRSAIKYRIHSDEKKDRYFYVWLSTDINKAPLRMSMDAPLGEIAIELVRITH